MRGGNFESQRPTLIILSGLPGSGKTTFARALAAVLPFEHIESDAIRRSMNPHPTYSGPESARVFALAERRAEAALQAGRVALIDATNLATSDRKRFLELASRAGADLVAVRLTAPESVVRVRLSSPREGFSQATSEIYDMMRARPQLFALPIVIVDTRFALEPSVALVAALCHRESASGGL